MNILFKYGLTKINNINSQKSLLKFDKIAKLEKGIEVGSNNYYSVQKSNSINYIRVGDLLSKTNTYIDDKIVHKIATENDILIAFDGAPGRNNVGLSGAFSSGIYKIICDEKNKGLCFFELNSDLNQKIITDHSQGTTILHASKAIPQLVCAMTNEIETKELNFIFNRMVYLKKQITKLQKAKNILLNKYFTNQ